MNRQACLDWTHSESFKTITTSLYGVRNSLHQSERYEHLIQTFTQHFPDAHDLNMFSASGRIEVGGNHTDHQLGQVLAAAIHLDTVAVVQKRDDMIIQVIAKGYEIQAVNLTNLEIQKDEYYTSMGLIRGLAFYFKELTHSLGGFNAYIESDVFSGSGLSSSAAFEVLIAQILNHLYGHQTLDASTLAIISQKAENTYFNKPCGLMDQMAIAQGGFCAIDFYHKDTPVVTPIKSKNLLNEYEVCLVQTGGSHADLSFAYAQITEDMRLVSEAFKVTHLSRVNPHEFETKLSTLNQTLPTRALLRAHHYFEEIKRVDRLKEAIQTENTPLFLETIIASGRSSYMYLQNIMHPTSEAQPLALALAMAERLLSKDGAWRVHGGGFGGTILLFVPKPSLDSVKAEFESVYGPNSFITVHIRPLGVTCLI